MQEALSTPRVTLCWTQGDPARGKGTGPGEMMLLKKQVGWWQQDLTVVVSEREDRALDTAYTVGVQPCSR